MFLAQVLLVWAVVTCENERIEKDRIVKIDNSVSPVGGSPGPSRGGSAKPATSSSKGSSSADVALSPLSARLQEMSAGMASAPPVDASRVAEIKQAISEGRYTVNAGKIADGLIDSVRQMLSARR